MDGRSSLSNLLSGLPPIPSTPSKIRPSPGPQSQPSIVNTVVPTVPSIPVPPRATVSPVASPAIPPLKPPSHPPLKMPVVKAEPIRSTNKVEVNLNQLHARLLQYHHNPLIYLGYPIHQVPLNLQPNLNSNLQLNHNQFCIIRQRLWNFPNFPIRLDRRHLFLINCRGHQNHQVLKTLTKDLNPNQY